jgi:hypothetical protein
MEPGAEEVPRPPDGRVSAGYLDQQACSRSEQELTGCQCEKPELVRPAPLENEQLRRAEPRRGYQRLALLDYP